MATIGTTLRAARVKRGLTIDQAAQDTRISRKFLEAIESEEFDALPAPVYVRGFLRSYANYLRIDSQPLLEELNHVLDSPVAGPDGFVGGPQQRRSGPQQRSDPWKRAPQEKAPQARSRAPQPPPDDDYDEYDAPPPNLRLRESSGRAGTPPPRRGVVPMQPQYDEPDYDEVEPEYDDVPAYAPPPRRAAAPPPPPPRYVEPEYDDYDDAPPEPVPYRRRTAEGVLVARPGAQGDDGNNNRPIAIAGAVFILAVFAGAIFLLLRSIGGDDGGVPAAGDPTETPTIRIETSVAVGTTTPGTGASPSPSAAATGSATATGSASVTRTVTATQTPGGTAPTATQQSSGPTATQVSATATPTATATQATPTATNTPPPPTPTPTLEPPTPIPTPIQAHPFGYAECTNNTCGDPPLLVICAPDGWFVDVGRDYDNPGWPTAEVIRIGDAQNAC